MSAGLATGARAVVSKTFLIDKVHSTSGDMGDVVCNETFMVELASPADRPSPSIIDIPKSHVTE